MKLCRGLWYFEDVCCPWTAERRQSIPFDGALLTSGYNYLLWPWTICGNLDTTGSWWRKTEFIRDEIAVTEVSSTSLPPTPKRRPGDPFWSIKTLILWLVPFFSFMYVFGHIFVLWEGDTPVRSIYATDRVAYPSWRRWSVSKRWLIAMSLLIKGTK